MRKRLSVPCEEEEGGEGGHPATGLCKFQCMQLCWEVGAFEPLLLVLGCVLLMGDVRPELFPLLSAPYLVASEVVLHNK